VKWNATYSDNGRPSALGLVLASTDGSKDQLPADAIEKVAGLITSPFS